MSIFKSVLLEASLINTEVFFKDILSIEAKDDNLLSEFQDIIIKEGGELANAKTVYLKFKDLCGLNIKKYHEYFKLIIDELNSINKQEDFRTIIFNVKSFHEKVYRSLDQSVKDDILDGLFDYVDLCKRLYLTMDKISLEDNYLKKYPDTWEKVAENDLWLAIYPKTQQAFIEWSTTMSDMTKESYKGTPEARVSWCTSRKEANNLWTTYATSAACFILVKKQANKIPSLEKVDKICKSLEKQGYSYEDVDEKRKQLLDSIEKMKKENETLNIYGYNKKDKYRRISFKIDVSDYTIQDSGKSLKDYGEIGTEQLVMYDMDAVELSEKKASLTNSVNADNSLMTMSVLQKVVPKDIISACIEYTKSNFSKEEGERPLDLFLKKQKLKDIKEMLAVITNFITNKNPITDPANQVYYSEAADFMSLYLYNKGEEQAIQDLDNILNDKVLNKAVDITACITSFFYYGTGNSSKEDKLINKLFNHFLQNDYSLLGNKIHKNILLGDMFKHKNASIITIETQATFHRLNLEITSGFFANKRKRLFYLYKNAKTKLEKDRFNKIICSNIIRYKDEDFSKKEVSDELEFGVFISNYIDEDINHFSSYIKWLINKINRFSSSQEELKETAVDICGVVSDTFGDDSFHLKITLEIMEEFFNNKTEYDTTSFIIDDIDLNELVYSHSYISKLFNDSNLVKGEKQKFNDLNGEDVYKIVSTLCNEILNNRMIDIDALTFFDIIEAICTLEEINSANQIVNCCLEKPFVLNYFKLGYQVKKVEKFKELVEKNKSSIDNAELFLTKLQEKHYKQKDFEDILTKMKIRDEEYSELLKKAERGEIDLNSYIRFLSLL
jgi:hypothetical protein